MTERKVFVKYSKGVHLTTDVQQSVCGRQAKEFGRHKAGR